MEYSFTIPGEVLWTVPLGLLGVFIVISSIKYARVVRADNLASRLKQKQEQRTQIEEMLPEPWISVFDECATIKNHATRVMWLTVWLKRQAEWTAIELARGNPGLPTLSLKSIIEFATMIAGGSTYGNDFKDVLAKLSPYLIVPSGKPNAKKISGITITDPWPIHPLGRKT